MGSDFDFVGPLAGTGLVGVFFLMIVLRIKIMPTYVYDEARTAWERERTELRSALESAENALREGQAVLVQQITPALTRALDVERELLDVRRQEQFRQRLGDAHG